MVLIPLAGTWRCEIPGRTADIILPGTLDENRIGYPDMTAAKWHPDAAVNAALQAEGVIATRLTRCCTYEGPATITRRLRTAIPPDRRVFLEAERARFLSLSVNGKPVPPFLPPTISTPYIFEVTGFLTGDDLFSLISDNSYPGWPHDAIVFSSAATDETQTNWNGLLGFLHLRVENPVFLHAVRVYPHGQKLDICAVLSAAVPWHGVLRAESEALAEPARAEGSVEPGLHEIWFRNLPLVPDVRRWDEGEGNLYTLSVSSEGLETKTVSFGVRDFGNQSGRLALNGRGFFLRGETNCALFPETGHPPMEVEAWTDILKTYRAYGVNCVRFHSHVPPEAAFEAADRLGMLMQPELSHWNPRDAFEQEESFAYYRDELTRVILQLANHPSFVMLTLGNELCTGELGRRRMDALLALARSLDPTRLYANASNAHYGALGCDLNSDFYTSERYFEEKIRATCANMQGPLNHIYANAKLNYSSVIKKIHETYPRPVFSFEVGQYEVLPDFAEIDEFQGITRADNLALIRAKVREANLEAEWPLRVEASGELSRLCYRAEIEAALLSEGMSGISLLSLQDFTGQGTALVGMMNSHLKPKPYPFAAPERFESFFRACLPLVMLNRFTYESGERLSARVRMANYGKQDLTGCLRWTLGSLTGDLPAATAPCGGLADLGVLEITLGDQEIGALSLRVSFAGWENAYPVWVYPPAGPVCPEGVLEARHFNDSVKAVLAAGGVVYLSPDSCPESLPHSIQAQFSTDFWSVGTFPGQEGGMGQLIDAAHPIFRRFPTESHTDWQWWPMANQRAFILPEPLRAIVTEMDSYATMRPMAQMLEARFGNGRVLLSSLGLHQLQQYPEARALQAAIYHYLSSADFAPDQFITEETLRFLVSQ